MIDVQSALQFIRQASRPLESEMVVLGQAVGRVLAQPIIADLDSPPFDKSMMDGFAVRSADFIAGSASLKVVDRIVAGQKSSATVSERTAIQIMTGAAIPSGADAVVMLEETAAPDSPQSIRVQATNIRAGQNIIRQGSLYRRGDSLVSAGHRIASQDVGLLAEAGACHLAVHRRPSVAVLATGNEICPPNQVPTESQIRNSNGPLLLSLIQAQNAVPVDLGSAKDDEQVLSSAIERGLAADVLVLTGGVSVGMLDLVPRVLKSLGVRQIFHKVSLKPGKPVWFGAIENGDKRSLVFGLPGNPVSTFVCFHLLVRESLAALCGEANLLNRPIPRGMLCKSHAIRGDRPTYWPSRMSVLEGRAIIEPLDWKGSADQRCLTEANCLAVFPDGNRSYSAESLVEIRYLS